MHRLDTLFGGGVFAPIKLPAIRFFTPLELFWKELPKFSPNKKIIEAGCGSGYLIDESKIHGYKWLGVDIIERDNGNKDIAIMDIFDLGLSLDATVIVCRPDHGGWCQELIDHCLSIGVTVVYVGLPRNFVQDIDPEQLKEITHKIEDVGEEGECMLVWQPEHSHLESVEVL